jgi:hypothetical protein
MQHHSDELLTPQELSDRWKGQIALGTLANWRVQNKGPKYIRIGGKPFYRLTDVIQYEDNQE